MMRTVSKVLTALGLFAGVLAIVAAVSGCQSPRAYYANGLILWCSTSAIGIGYGQYAEIPAGGSFTYAGTNSAPCVWADGPADSATSFSMSNIPQTNRFEVIK